MFLGGEGLDGLVGLGDIGLLVCGVVATGSSVTKTASGGEEIVVQGDNSNDIFDWVVDVGKVPEDNVECIEDKKKKSAG